MQANEQRYVVDGTYRKIAEDLISNRYSIGTKLQPLRALAKKYNVSYLTAQRAIKVLQMQGALEAKPGDGIYVVGKLEPLTGSAVEYLEEKEGSNRPARNNLGTYSIGVVMPFWLSTRGSGAIYEIVRGILSESDKLQWTVELIHNSGNESAMPEFVDKIERRALNGIVWLQPTPWHKMNLMRLVDKGYEVVVTGRNFKDIPVECVQFDHSDMAKKVMNYFQEVGASKIGMFTGPVEGSIDGPSKDSMVDPYSVDIVNAMRTEMESRGMELPHGSICQAFMSHRHDLIIEDFVRRNPEMDGFVCLHETLLPDIERLDQKGLFGNGKKVPLIDVSGIFNADLHEMNNVDIIGIKWPLESIGTNVIIPFKEKWTDEECLSRKDLSVEIGCR